MAIGVVIAHEYLAHAEALAALVDAQPDLSVVGVVTSAQDARTLLSHEETDVLLVDLEQAVASSLRAEEVGVRVLALARTVTVAMLEQAIALGAHGLVGREAPATEVLSALRSEAPSMTVSGTTLDRLLADAQGWVELRPSRGRRQDHVHLTRRERQVLRLMRNGLDAKSIAADLHVSVHTARSHIKKLLAKLGAHSQLEAVAIANKLGVQNDEQRN